MFPLKDNIPTERFPVVTVALIVANAIVYFFLQDGLLGLPAAARRATGRSRPTRTSRARVTGRPRRAGTGPGADRPTWLTVFTAMFMHGGLLHLGGNMLFLWIFGNNVEDSMGPVKFVVFYLLGGHRGDGAADLDRPRLARCRTSARRARWRRCSAATCCCSRAPA